MIRLRISSPKYVQVVCICFIGLYSLSLSAQTINGIEYQVINNSAKTVRTGRVVKSSDGTSYYHAVSNYVTGTVTIPPTIKYGGTDYTVVEIGPYSFKGTKISGIELPETITSIETSAFQDCSNLKFINIPSSLQRIESSAFNGCSLSKVIIPDIAAWCRVQKKTMIVSSKFFMDEDTEIVNLNIPEGVTSIEAFSFWGQSRLASLSLPMSLKNIGQNAFQSCTQLDFIELPDSLETIGALAFGLCNIAAYVIPRTVTSIGSGAFDYRNSNLKKIYSLIDSPQVIEKLKNSFNYIEDGVILYVPYGTSSLYEKSVGAATFSMIKEIGVPLVANIQRNDEKIFTEFLVNSNTPEKLQLGLGTSSAIPNDIEGFYSIPSMIQKGIQSYCVDAIGEKAFDKCISLDSIYIPQSIKVIKNAFDDCLNLRSICIDNRNPKDICIEDLCFNNLPSDAILYVPAGTKERYEALEPWNKFSQIVESSPISTGDVEARFGSKAELPIYLKNTETIEGLQFKLTLPEGVSVVEQDSYLVASTTERTEGMTIMGRKDPDSENSYLFVLLSLDGNSINGTEGAIMNVQLDIAQNIELGVYDIKIEDVYMTNSSFDTVNPTESSSELTIKDYMLGDVNNDGIVNVTDAIGIVNYVLKNTPVTFIEGAADVNGDGIINVTDAIGIINKILN